VSVVPRLASADFLLSHEPLAEACKIPQAYSHINIIVRRNGKNPEAAIPSPRKLRRQSQPSPSIMPANPTQPASKPVATIQNQSTVVNASMTVSTLGTSGPSPPFSAVVLTIRGRLASVSAQTAVNIGDLLKMEGCGYLLLCEVLSVSQSDSGHHIMLKIVHSIRESALRSDWLPNRS
jgi:hypothetical protein